MTIAKFTAGTTNESIKSISNSNEVVILNICSIYENFLKYMSFFEFYQSTFNLFNKPEAKNEEYKEVDAAEP